MSRKPHAEEEDGFLTRWSRRKHSGSVEGPGGDHDSAGPMSRPDKAPGGSGMPERDTSRGMITRPTDGDGTDAAVNGLPAKTPVLTDADMPDLDTLDEGSDYSGFFSPGVSDKLRKMALRKLFFSAGFNIRDGLDDYDDDFTEFTPLGDIVTSDMKHRAEVAEMRRKEAEAGKEEPVKTDDPEEARVAETLREPDDDCQEADGSTSVTDDPDSGLRRSGPDGDPHSELAWEDVSSEAPAENPVDAGSSVEDKRPDSLTLRSSDSNGST